jgi:hypothetical protein
LHLATALIVLLKPRMCANGIAAPITDPLYRKTAEGLRVVVKDVLRAAQAKNRERVIELAEPLRMPAPRVTRFTAILKGPEGSATPRSAAKSPRDSA